MFILFLVYQHQRPCTNSVPNEGGIAKRSDAVSTSSVFYYRTRNKSDKLIAQDRAFLILDPKDLNLTENDIAWSASDMKKDVSNVCEQWRFYILLSEFGVCKCGTPKEKAAIIEARACNRKTNP